MFRKKQFDTLFFFVTSKCNAKCETCFYWDKLNQRDDLTFEEIAQLSDSLPPFSELWLSGGEPTLRRELYEIIRIFIERNGIKTVMLPTNAIDTEKTYRVVENVLTTYPDLTLFVNVAVDGLCERHDKIRGVPNNFARTEETVKQLSRLRGKFPNYKLHVNTVINKENYLHIRELAEYIKQEWEIDGQFFQIIRGGPKNPVLLDVPGDTLKEIYDYAAEVHAFYSKSLLADSPGLAFLFKKIYSMGTFLFHYKIQYETYTTGANWLYPCMAGQTMAVVDHNGDVRVCELREPVGNLRDYGMDFQKLMRSIQMRNEVKDIQENPCPCTHVCFIHTSLRYSPSTLLYRIPKEYFTHRWHQHVTR